MAAGLRAGAARPLNPVGVAIVKNPFSKSSPISKIEADIAQKEAARGELTKKQSLVDKALEEHKTAMRAFVRDNPSLDPPAELRHSVAIARDHLEAIVESIAEGDQQLVDLRTALAATRDQDTRDEAARADEALADFVDKEVAPELAKAAAIFGKACAAFMARVPEGLNVVEARSWSREQHHPLRHHDHFIPAELLRAIVAENLFAAAPDLFEHRSSVFGRDQVLARMFGLDRQIPEMRSDGTPPAAIRDPATVLLSDRLRARAAAKRAGQPTAVDSDPAPAAAPEPDIAADVEVFATRDFAFVENASGRHHICQRRWVHLVPSLVADAAVDQDVALRTDTPEGQDAFDAEKQYRKNSMSIPESGLGLADCFDLGDVLGLVEDPGEDLAAAE
ncbi:hypothetical protein [Mesorhizobium sp. M0019]|uniref:hypothetical protein n=1 Tax=Mesorhizobium sp. M0019 TaxID=2956845 RepID=UPI00333A5E1F